MRGAELARWIRAPVLSGRLAVLGAVAALGVPTIIRLLVNGAIAGCEFTPYLPFILLSAIFVGWLPTTFVALAAVATLGGLFVGPDVAHLQSACFISGAAIFLGSSAMIIGTVVAIQRVFSALDRRGLDESSDGILFSLEQGQVYASWYGQGPPVLLGSRQRVGTMMKDFLAQEELAKRLNGHTD